MPKSVDGGCPCHLLALEGSYHAIPHPPAMWTPDTCLILGQDPLGLGEGWMRGREAGDGREEVEEERRESGNKEGRWEGEGGERD